ncbi:hypothetical protein TPHA_0B04210 [Tetrapisispora phaffii CBS 4417]|uniref:DNA repair protein RAD50 n=1 Tax=Tetrapisispora phaffii (strain ATCC 24235 / CBS 4417 / NBRC 1672 / NRRL Y-8282 / UCD 70-5) TaxID=1071381 RepID=G8BQ10_TETPH|nr:hypothetical protein TPHA_0B04210 [Tetrapisispora phaffii CBS 4417]CCE62091.1 hypothetical protein TPHA_0B04210 [Tetrapisispora phaffii CBS 4417]
MSAIYKLSIQGIRSFDSNDRETIEFGKPLTLIVGSNGSGKTTIIECLKYATTGDLPPNSKGGAFVHDPKITGEKDIRAQVKLAFTSANGLNMIVTRNIQLLVKKTNNTFKTLDGQLVSITQDGYRSTLSTRTTDLDTHVPLYMGVPKAILEYVIFCHQEDSLWPLSEPANLKKKFDEIFQAMKFTKALDNLKVIKKDMSVDIKLLKQSVEHLKVDKDRSKATKFNIEKLQHKCEQFKKTVKEIESQLVDITKQSDEVFKTNQDFQKVLAHLENLKRNREYISHQINRLSETINVISLPVEEIEQNLVIFDRDTATKDDQIKQLENDISELKQNVNQIQEQSNILLEKQGKLKSYYDIYINNLSSLKNLKENVSRQYNINKEFSDETFQTALNDHLDKENNHLLQLNNTFSNELEGLNSKKSTLDYDLVVQLQQQEYNKKDKIKASEKLDNIHTELIKITCTEEELNVEKENLTKYIDKLKIADGNDTATDVNLEIKKENDHMLLLEKELEETQEMITKANKQSDLYAKLALIKKSSSEKQMLFDKNLNILSMNPVILSEPIIIDENIEITFNTFFKNLQKNLEDDNNKLQSITREYTEADIRTENCKEELDKTENLIGRLEKKLVEMLPEDCPIDEYDDALLESEASYKTAVENLKMHQTTLAFNRKALEVAENSNCCYLCSREFDSTGLKSKLLNELKAKTNQQFELDLVETMKHEKEYLDSLRKLEKDVNSLFNERELVNKLKTDFESNKTKSDKLRAEVKIQDAHIKSLKEKLETVTSTIRPLIEENFHLQKEISSLNNDLQNITDELKLYNISSDGLLTLEELQSKQTLCNQTLREKRKKISLLQDGRESRAKEKATLSGIIKDRSLKVEKMKNDLLKKESLENERNLKLEEVSNIEVRLNSFEKDVKLLQNKITEINANITKLKDQHDKAALNKKEIIEGLSKTMDQFKTLQNSIKEFELTGNADLKACNEELEDYKSKLKNINVAIDQKTANLSKLKEELIDSNSRKKNLMDNLELHSLKVKLSNTEKEINCIDVENAERQRDKYQEEISRLRNLYEQLSADNAGKLGEIKQLQNQIDSLSHQLHTDYKDIDNKYKTEWAKLQTKTFVTEDINTYSKALDSAIMRYHGLKMQDINRIIDELWKKTYSGTDVDSIQIRSDETSSTVKGKSYNYRVVMFKQDAELDMRGRCSAGQKVLASIIIRLALSETFGVNCGVIALDEPTTNLDEENIESLAKSLHNIIQFRQHQKNFQLIVITHDEKFLNNMNASQFSDHFFKVKRDDRQKSLIEWVDINKVVD